MIKNFDEIIGDNVINDFNKQIKKEFYSRPHPEILQKIETVFDQCLSEKTQKYTGEELNHILEWIQWSMKSSDPTSIRSLINKGYRLAFLIFNQESHIDVISHLKIELCTMNQVVYALLSGLQVTSSMIVNCAIMGRVDILFFLQSIGVEIDVRDTLQEPILPFLAVQYHQDEVLKFLIHEGFSLEGKWNITMGDITFSSVNLLVLDVLLNPESNITQILLSFIDDKNPHFYAQKEHGQKEPFDIFKFLINNYIFNVRGSYEKLRIYMEYLCANGHTDVCMDLLIKITYELSQKIPPQHSFVLLNLIKMTVIKFDESLYIETVAKILQSQYSDPLNGDSENIKILRSLMNHAEDLSQRIVFLAWNKLKDIKSEKTFLQDFPSNYWNHLNVACTHNFYYWMQQLQNTDQNKLAIAKLKAFISPELVIKCLEEDELDYISILSNLEEVVDKDNFRFLLRKVLDYYFNKNNYNEKIISFLVSFLNERDEQDAEMINYLATKYLANENQLALRRLTNFFLEGIWLSQPRISVIDHDEHWYLDWKPLITHLGMNDLQPNEKDKRDLQIGKELFRRKVIAHLSHYDGECIYPISEKVDVPIKYSGFSKCDGYFFTVLQNGFKYSTTPVDEETEKFFKNAKELDIEKLRPRIINGEPCSYPSGFTGHSIEILFYGNFLVVIDTAIFVKEQSFQIYRIDSQKISLELLQKLRDMRFKGGCSEQLNTLINEMLLDLKGEKHTCSITSFGKDEFLHKKQRVGNCTYASKEASFYYFLRLKDLKEVAQKGEWLKKLSINQKTKESWLLKHEKTEEVFYHVISASLLKFLNKEIDGIMQKSSILPPDRIFIKRVLEKPLYRVLEKDKQKFKDLAMKIDQHLSK